MRQSLLVKAKERFSDFNVQRPSLDIPLSKNDSKTKNAVVSQQNCLFSLFACFQRGNNSTMKHSTDYKLKKYPKKPSRTLRRSR